MVRFEYLAIFYGIIIGLALGNIASSVHKLLEAGNRVRWHWMAPTNAAGVTVATLGQFWAWWIARDTTFGQPIFLTYLPGSVASLLLYVVCALTLPDTVPEAGINLREFYFSSARRFWSVFAIYLLLRLFQQTMFITLAKFDLRPFALLLPFLFALLVMVPIAVSLAYVRAPWWHGLWICLFFVIALALFGPMRL